MKLSHIFSILAASATVFAASSCVQSLADDADASASGAVTKLASDSTRKLSVDVDVSAGTTFDNTSDDLTYIDLLFSAPVAKATAEKAISVYALSGTDSDKLYTESALSYTAHASSDSTIVTLALNLKGKDGIRIFIDPTKIASTAGAKLDEDSDYSYAESGDDDVFFYIYASAPSATFAGAEIEELDDGEFASLSFANDSTVTTQPSYYDMVLASVESDRYDANTDYASVLTANVKAQYWDKSAEVWKDVSLTFARNANEDSTYITGLDNRETR